MTGCPQHQPIVLWVIPEVRRAESDSGQPTLAASSEAAALRALARVGAGALLPSPTGAAAGAAAPIQRYFSMPDLDWHRMKHVAVCAARRLN